MGMVICAEFVIDGVEKEENQKLRNIQVRSVLESNST